MYALSAAVLLGHQGNTDPALLVSAAKLHQRHHRPACISPHRRHPWCPLTSARKQDAPPIWRWVARRPLCLGRRMCRPHQTHNLAKGVRWALASARLPPRGQGGQSTRVRKFWAILFATVFLGRASILPLAPGPSRCAPPASPPPFPPPPPRPSTCVPAQLF